MGTRHSGMRPPKTHCAKSGRSTLRVARTGTTTARPGRAPRTLVLLPCNCTPPRAARLDGRSWVVCMVADAL
jgi:hypothetical protein